MVINSAPALLAVVEFYQGTACGHRVKNEPLCGPRPHTHIHTHLMCRSLESIAQYRCWPMGGLVCTAVHATGCTSWVPLCWPGWWQKACARCHALQHVRAWVLQDLCYYRCDCFRCMLLPTSLSAGCMSCNITRPEADGQVRCRQLAGLQLRVDWRSAVCLPAAALCSLFAFRGCNVCVCPVFHLCTFRRTAYFKEG